jgi:hypothetical protein
VLVGARGGDGWGDREGTAAASGQPADTMVKGSLEVRAVDVGGACAVFLEISSWGNIFGKGFFLTPQHGQSKGLLLEHRRKNLSEI